MKTFWIPVLFNLFSFSAWATNFEPIDYFDPVGESAGASAMAIDSQGAYFTGGGISNASSESAWLIRRSFDGGHSWKNILRYQLAPKKYAQVYGMAVDRNDHLYATGPATDSAGRWHAIIQRSRDHGKSWELVDDFVYPDTTLPINRAYRIAVSPTGEIFSVIQVYDNFEKVRKALSVVRRSRDQGRTWVTVDVCQDCASHVLRFDPHGNIFTLGMKYMAYGPTNPPPLMQLRRATPDATHWEDVDILNAEKGSFGMALMFDTSGNAIIAANYGKTDRLVRMGIIRVWSPTQGATTVAEFNLVSDNSTHMVPYDIISNADGRILVTGYGVDKNQKYHRWIFEKPIGKNWKFSLDSMGTKNLGAVGAGFAYDQRKRKLINFGSDYIDTARRAWAVFREMR